MNFKSVYVSGLLAVWPVMQGMAQSELIKFGDFDQWIVRNIKESGIIGGDTKQLYEIGPDAVWNENKAYTNQGGSPWATSNVMAKVCGITKTNTSVYREKRGDGYCARLETHVEKVKVMGIVNIEVLAAGSVFLGSVPEPITNTSNPMSKLAVGIPFTKRPQAISFDYKVKLSDEQGNVYAQRIGTMIHRFNHNTDWVNGAKFPIKYGDITKQPGFQSYMGLISGDKTQYTRNSKGKMVPIKEVGWADAGETPTHIVLQFDSSYGGAYVGSVGTTLWLDNVHVIY